MNRKCANVGAENFQPNAIGSCKSFNQVHQGSDNSYTCTKTVRKYSNDMLIINRKVYDKNMCAMPKVPIISGVQFHVPCAAH